MTNEAKKKKREIIKQHRKKIQKLEHPNEEVENKPVMVFDHDVNSQDYEDNWDDRLHKWVPFKGNEDFIGGYRSAKDYM